MYIHNLEERIPYTFSVRAQTIDYGPPAIGNVTTGPQPGSPGRPRDLVLSQVRIVIIDKLRMTNVFIVDSLCYPPELDQRKFRQRSHQWLLHRVQAER